jgi:hypothetical protein
MAGDAYDPDQVPNTEDEPWPGLDEVHPCPRCGAAPIASPDGFGRLCEYCGWMWMLDDGTRSGHYDERLLQTGRRHLPRMAGGMQSLFVRGETPSFLTAREVPWKKVLTQALLGMWRHPRLEFRVAAWQRGFQHFDLDNLYKPVLDLVGSNAASVWRRIALGEPAGVHLWEERPPSPPTPLLRVELPNPPTRSLRREHALPELVGVSAIEGDALLGVSLAFHSPTVRVGDFGFDGPVKALLEAMGPVFGTYREGPRDYRLGDLRIERGGVQPDRGGVNVAIWPLVDAADG